VAEAPSLQADYEEFGSRGFIPVTLIAENDVSATPSQDDLNEWVAQFGLTHPVVADDGWVIGNRFEVDYGIPSMTLIAPGGEILFRDEYITATEIEEALAMIEE
jgi:hypothetical protein